MEAEEFQLYVGSLVYGKILPGACYIYRPSGGDLPDRLQAEIRRAEIAAKPAADWTLLKLHRTQFALTFLSYPEFDVEPHPALAEATKINLSTGLVVCTDYRQRTNPPILHRKEAFLPPGDSRIASFAALTAQEEAAGLFRDLARIGLRQHWLALLRRHGLSYRGHELTRVERNADGVGTDAEPATEALIERHRTAIKRYDLSKPVKQLLERGLLRKQDTFFDYGCGHGMDVEALRTLGYKADGWDPAFRPDSQRTSADVVNLGYVLNVIEDPDERAGVLRSALSLTKRILLVSTLAAGQESESHARRYRDGFLTKANTFQKFFAPGELEALIESSLNLEASTLGLGMCAVFRSDDDAELFEATRTRRRIDWTEISTHLQFSAPISREQRRLDRYDLHKELFTEFWDVLLDLGRRPEVGEFDRLPEVKKAAGGLNRAVALVTSRYPGEVWQRIRNARTEDVLVYLAMTRFRKRFLQREIPLRIKNDIRSFFGDLATAQVRAGELLFAAGDPGEIDLACEHVDLGWQDEDALIIHRDLLSELPPILRIYVHCAAYRYGDPAQADLIKIHKHSGKITFQHYDDFSGKPLPVLQTRIKVNLRNFFVEVFDHSAGPKQQLLYFKERFVAKDDPGRAKMDRFSKKLRRLGLNEVDIGFGPDAAEFSQLTAAAGLNERLVEERRKQQS